jgi:hypothetical protein
MTSRDFVIWLKGFVAGSNNFNLTPSGWDEVKNQLNKIEDIHKAESTKKYIETPKPEESKVF